MVRQQILVDLTQYRKSDDLVGSRERIASHFSSSEMGDPVGTVIKLVAESIRDGPAVMTFSEGVRVGGSEISCEGQQRKDRARRAYIRWGHVPIHIRQEQVVRPEVCTIAPVLWYHGLGCGVSADAATV